MPHLGYVTTLSIMSCFYIERRLLMKLEGWHLVVIRKERENDSDYIANDQGTHEGESAIVHQRFHKVLQIKWMVRKWRECKQSIIVSLKTCLQLSKSCEITINNLAAWHEQSTYGRGKSSQSGWPQYTLCMGWAEGHMWIGRHMQWAEGHNGVYRQGWASGHQVCSATIYSTA